MEMSDHAVTHLTEKEIVLASQGQGMEVFETETGFNAKVHHYIFVIPERNA
jgi:hypothetical protein